MKVILCEHDQTYHWASYWSDPSTSQFQHFTFVFPQRATVCCAGMTTGSLLCSLTSPRHPLAFVYAITPEFWVQNCIRMRGMVLKPIQGRTFSIQGIERVSHDQDFRLFSRVEIRNNLCKFGNFILRPYHVFWTSDWNFNISFIWNWLTLCTTDLKQKV